MPARFAGEGSRTRLPKIDTGIRLKRIGKSGESLVRIPLGRDSCDDLDQIFILIDYVEKPVATLDRILVTEIAD
jgi:hypothetical protein